MVGLRAMHAVALVFVSAFVMFIAAMYGSFVVALGVWVWLANCGLYGLLFWL